MDVFYRFKCLSSRSAPHNNPVEIMKAAVPFPVVKSELRLFTVPRIGEVIDLYGEDCLVILLKHRTTSPFNADLYLEKL